MDQAKTGVAACTKCNYALSENFFNTLTMKECPSCGVPLRVDVFPSLFKPLPAGRPGDTLVIDNESSCFYHPQKKAVIPCDNCGRFLCALCDIELNGQHLCPTCLEAGKKKGALKSLENHRVLYDSSALRLALYPILIWWLTLITAPVALFLAIRYWKAPSSIMPRTKIRFILAIVFASVQIVGWGTLFYHLAT